jgi:hypothetical protein
MIEVLRCLASVLKRDAIMRYLRYNIVSILGAILFVAIGLAALRDAVDLWDSGLFSVTVCLLLTAVILAVHRTAARRAFWIGFALFGWGYLSLSLIPSTESRLITTKALAYLDQAKYAMRILMNPDRMRAYNLSTDDILKALQPSSLRGSPEPFSLAMSDTSHPTEYVLTLATPYNNPEQYGNIILKANPDGEILRLKDIAEVELVSSYFILGGAAGTTQNFMRIGHSLFALLFASLGGLLSRRLGRASRAPEMSTEVAPR